MVAPTSKSKEGKKKKKDGGGGGGEHKDHKDDARPPTIDCPKSAVHEGKGEGDKGLPNCVTFFPDVITFQPENKKQVRNLEVKNKGDQSIMYKMKSTSPGVYRMRPIHFLLRPGESKIIKLSYKGCPDGKAPNLKDRFTVVMAYPPGSEANIKLMWTQKAYVEKLADCTHRKYIKVHFDGYDIPDKKAATPSKMADPLQLCPPPAAAPAAPAAPSPQPQPGMPGWPGMPGMPGGGGVVYVIYQGDQQGQGGKAAQPSEGQDDDKDDKEGEEEEEEEDEKEDKDKKKK